MKKILNILLGLLFVGLSAQTTTVPSGVSTTENYVYSRTYLEAVTASDSTAKQVQGIQYFDGLGRPKQSIAIKASPLGRDIVTPIVYDGFGRQTRDYLPIPQSSTTNGTIYTQSTGLVNYPVSDPTNIYSSEKIYSEKVLESSPLDRVLQQVQVGNDWSGKPIKFDYLTNVGDAVNKYTITTTWSVANTDIYTTTSSLPVISTYADNNLYKNKVTDEDGNESYEFKNGQGQTILVRKVLSATESADTYYVYNEYDQLALVIPPLASVKATLLQSDLDELCYQYRYDNQNRLVEKKLPGKGWEFMVYDKQDRLVLTQDAMLRGTTNNFAKRGWLFTKYDQFGRVVYTGFFANTATRETMQKSLNSMNSSNNESRSSTGFNQNGLIVYYTKVAFPTGSMTILSVNYYDQYPTDLSTIPTTIQGETLLTTAPQTTEQRSLKSLAVASFVKNIDTDSWTKSYSFYDLKGRAIGSHSYNYLGGYTKTESKLDFAGVPQESYTYHKRLSTDTEIIIKERFEYDGQNRMVKHYHQVDANPEELLANNEYNELGQLKNKKVGGLSTATTPLQTVDYQYNIRGWMTQINNPSNLGTDLFGYKIKYNNPSNTTLAPAKYNGNIAEIDWNTSTDNTLRRYGYIYDHLNRLNIASYQKPDASVPETHAYDENIYYDLNGNIVSLQRNGTTDGITGTQIDDLEYYYTGNQLNQVFDVSGNYDGYPDVSGNTITYDVNGNITSHQDKYIKTISYNYLNLPNQIISTGTIGRTTTNVNTVNTYRADGVKIKKTHQKPNLTGGIVTIITDYLDGFQYETGGTSATLQFVPTAEGYYDFTKNLYIYNYNDHLGNVRLSYADSNKNGAIEASTEIIEENNYYPFGLKHEGYNDGLAGNPKYQYKYQGQELQETGMYSFKWREYMPDIGRFAQIDPLATKYPYNSTYAFQENKMGLGRELEGLELVQDYRHAPKTSVIVTVKPQTRVKQLYGDKSNWYSFANVYSQLTGNAPNNLSVTTTQSVTTFIYKKGGKTVSSKSDADYLVVNKQETTYKNDFASLSTLTDVSFSEKKTTNTYEDYTVKNGKVSLVNITPSSQVSETLVNLPDTPSSHQKAVVKANNENTADSANQMVDHMKQNVSNNANNQMNSMEIPKKELERVPEQVKQSW